MQKSHLHTFFLTTLLTASTTLVNAQSKLPIKPLSIGIYAIQAEVAATDAARQQGLMMRTKMGASEGMIFDFQAPAGVCMWMKNTYLPLSVAFIDNEGVIINIEDMAPETTDSHCAKKSARYALEMNQGWFKQKNIKPGIKVEGLPLK
jgi:uncharacterized membrane protein (UPF0127 family)